WSSWPRYRSLLVRLAAFSVTFLVVGNLVLTPVWVSPSPTLPRNLVDHVKVVGVPGMSADQTMTTDERGYRTNGPIDYQRKPAGTLRIVAIGSGTVEQDFVDDRRTWPNLLADRLSQQLGRKVEMINTGFDGLRAKYLYRRLLEVEPLRPDLVIFQFGNNDWDQAIHDANQPAFFSFLDAHFSAFSVSDSPLFTGLRSASNLLAGTNPKARQIERGYFPDEFDSLSRPIKIDYRTDDVDPGYAAWMHKILDECRDRRL